MKLDDMTAIILIIIGIVGVLLTILTFGQLYGGEWQSVGNNVTLVAVAIGFFAIVLVGIITWMRK